MPLRAGQVERHTHDYRRNGSTDRYAAPELASGNVVAKTTISTVVALRRSSTTSRELVRDRGEVAVDLDVVIDVLAISVKVWRQ